MTIADLAFYVDATQIMEGTSWPIHGVGPAVLLDCPNLRGSRRLAARDDVAAYYREGRLAPPNARPMRRPRWPARTFNAHRLVQLRRDAVEPSSPRATPPARSAPPPRAARASAACASQRVRREEQIISMKSMPMPHTRATTIRCFSGTLCFARR